MSNFEISDYLDNLDARKRCGICKLCKSVVSWSRERVASHKRGNCINVPAEEKILFAKRKFIEVSSSDLNSSV